MSTEPYLGGEIAYVNGDLHVERVALNALAEDPEIETPVYVYSLAMMKRRYYEFEKAMREIDKDVLVCFSVKALSNQTVLGEFAGWGAGADLVTGGELWRALKAGFKPNKIVFSGLGKTDDDLCHAIREDVQISVESLSELDRTQVWANELKRCPRVAIRLNPQLEAMRGNLGQITTGKPDSKFGIPWSKVKDILPNFATSFPDINLVGISVHIGSNLDLEGNDAQSFAKTFQFLAGPVIDAFSAAGVKPIVVDLGGGVGIDYHQTPGERSSTGKLPNPNRGLVPYAELVRKSFGDLVVAGKVRLVFEPGRFLSGEAGVLLTKVLHVKKETEIQVPGEFDRPPFSIRFLIVDAGMNDLMRPSLYGAYHHIVPVRYGKPDMENVDICGPVCETTDSFLRPTREWLKRYNNLFEEPDVEALNDPRSLWAQASTFGEVAPKFKDSDDHARRTYEYFVKRRFPSSVDRNHLVAILNAGAYGAVMSSEYNSRRLIPEVLVDDDRYAVIRPRPTYEELIGRDCTPVWKG
jgi:diaminopimelate decarboxylase